MGGCQSKSDRCAVFCVRRPPLHLPAPYAAKQMGDGATRGVSMLLRLLFFRPLMSGDGGLAASLAAMYLAKSRYVLRTSACAKALFVGLATNAHVQPPCCFRKGGEMHSRDP